MVFNRDPLHELGCGFRCGSLSNLVDRRTPFIALAILRGSYARIVALHHPRELGKENGEIELFTKQKASSETTKVKLSGAGVPRVAAFRRRRAQALAKLFEVVGQRKTG